MTDMPEAFEDIRKRWPEAVREIMAGRMDPILITGHAPPVKPQEVNAHLLHRKTVSDLWEWLVDNASRVATRYVSNATMRDALGTHDQDLSDAIAILVAAKRIRLDGHNRDRRIIVFCGPDQDLDA